MKLPLKVSIAYKLIMQWYDKSDVDKLNESVTKY